MKGRGEGQTRGRLERPGGFSLAELSTSQSIRSKWKASLEPSIPGFFFVDQYGRNVSPWHDVPLSLGYETFHFIVEIPKESSAKMEVATDEPHTPIKQDTRRKTSFLSI
ncbi:unnamed protein product, partial [Vitis vinifera]